MFPLVLRKAWVDPLPAARYRIPLAYACGPDHFPGRPATQVREAKKFICFQQFQMTIVFVVRRHYRASLGVDACNTQVRYGDVVLQGQPSGVVGDLSQHMSTNPKITSFWRGSGSVAL